MITMTPPAPHSPAAPPRPLHRRLLWAGALSGPIFLLTAFVTGSTTPGYDQARHPISSLAIGEYGWIQIANFILCGVLTLGFAWGLRQNLHASARRTLAGPLLIAVWGLGMIGAGVFVADPVGGYPAGTAAQGVHTWHGRLHDFPFSTFGFLAAILACLVFARRFATWRQSGWAVYSALSAAVITAGVVTSNLGFAGTTLVGQAGLLQRLTVLAMLGWLTALAIRLLITRSTPPRRAH